MITQRLLTLVKPYWFRLVLAMICMAVVAAVTALMAYLVKPVLDDIFFKKNMGTLSLLPPFIVLLYIVKGGFGFGQSYLMSYVAILGVPMIIVYKVSPVNYWIAKRLIKVPYIGLVNWIAGEKIISEFIQDQVQPEALTEAALNLLNDPARREDLRTKMALVRQKLGGPGASRRVARMAREMLNG